MKKIIPGTMLLALLMIVPVSAKADVNVHVGIALPPAIVFSAPPVTVVIPGTYVYAVPDVPVDIFFYGGWWWRPWGGHWYRSRYYDRGWAYYKGRPSFYATVPPRWRDDYRDHRWQGYPWQRQRVPASQVQRNWKKWEKQKHWERRQYWGVPDMKSRPQPQQSPRSVQTQPRPQPQEMNRSQSRPQQREIYQPQPRPQSREESKDRQHFGEVRHQDSRSSQGGHEQRGGEKRDGKGRPEKGQGPK